MRFVLALHTDDGKTFGVTVAGGYCSTCRISARRTGPQYRLRRCASMNSRCGSQIEGVTSARVGRCA